MTIYTVHGRVDYEEDEQLFTGPEQDALQWLHANCPFYLCNYYYNAETGKHSLDMAHAGEIVGEVEVYPIPQPQEAVWDNTTYFIARTRTSEGN